MAERTVRMTLLPKFRDLLTKQAFIKCAYGGRGSGKSYSIAQILISKALESPKKILCARETQNSLSDSSLGVLKTVIKTAGLDDLFEETRHTLKCINGSEFIFRGLQQPQRIKSLEDISICWIDEAQTVRPESWAILLPTIRKEGAEIWVSFNPNNFTDFVYNEFVAKDNPMVAKALINYQDNPFISATLLEQIEYMKSTEYDKYLHVYEGQPIVHNDANIFLNKYKVISYALYKGLNDPENTDITDSIRSNMPSQNKPSNGIYYIGCDWGFAKDPTAIVRSFITDNNELVVDKEIYQYGAEIDILPELIKSIDGWEKAIIQGDSARPDTISYINNRLNGINTIHKAKKGPGSIIDGIEYIKSFKQVYVTSNCTNLIDELKLYSYVIDKRTGHITNVPEDKNNHIIDALRYGIAKSDKQIMAKIVFDERYNTLV